MLVPLAPLILIRVVKVVQILLMTASVVLACFFSVSLASICNFFNQLTIRADDCQWFYWKTQIAIAAAFYLIAILLVLPNLLRRFSASEISRFKNTPYDLYNDLIFRRGLIGSTYSLERYEPVAPRFEAKNFYGADVYLRHAHLTNKKYVLLFILGGVLVHIMVSPSDYSAKGILIKFCVIHSAGFLVYEAALYVLAMLLTSGGENKNE